MYFRAAFLIGCLSGSAQAGLVRLQPVESSKSLDAPGKMDPRLGDQRAPLPSAPFTFALTAATFTVQASMVQDLTLFRVHIVNGSSRTLAVSPHIFSAADGTKVMLKLLEPSEVTTILQADLRAFTPPPTPPTGGTRNSMTPLVHSLGGYFFGNLGMKSDTARLATALAEGISEGMAEVPVSYVPPPTITPAVVARDALTPTELEPGYSMSGIVFFTAPQSLPVTFMAKWGEAKSAVVFNTETPFEPASPGSTETAAPAPKIKRTPVSGLDAFFQERNPGEKVSLSLKNGSSVHGAFDSYADDGSSVKLEVRSGLFLFKKTYLLDTIKDAKRD